MKFYNMIVGLVFKWVINGGIFCIKKLEINELLVDFWLKLIVCEEMWLEGVVEEKRGEFILFLFINIGISKFCCYCKLVFIVIIFNYFR